MDEIEIVGFVGKTGVGKDFLASSLIPKGYTIMAFGDLLKEELMDHGWEFDELFMTKSGETRQVLQMYAEKILKRGDPYYFVKKMSRRVMISYSHGMKKIVIPDIRFREELDFIEMFPSSKIIRIKNESGNQVRLDHEHRSSEEEPLSDLEFPEYVNEIGKDPELLVEML